MTTKTNARKAAAALKASQRKAALANFAKAARQEGRALNTLADMVKGLIAKAWITTADGKNVPTDDAKEVRAVYLAAHLAGRLPSLHNLTDAAALKTAAAIVKKPGSKAVKTKADARQTPEEETILAAGRKSWERLLKAAGLEPVTARAKSAKRKPKAGQGAAAKPDDKSATIPLAKAAPYMPPKVQDREQVTAWVREHIALIRATIEQANQKLMAKSGETLPVAMCSAIEDCKRALDAIK